MPDIIKLASLLVFVFFIVAFYYALRHPNGPVFPLRRSDLLRKVGPLVTGQLNSVAVRFLTKAGGIERVLLQVVYHYSINGEVYTITLPTDSLKVGAARIQRAVTSLEFEHQVPDRLELSDGTVLADRASIREYYRAQVQAYMPEVQVLYSKKQPAFSTVRDWA
jgi:hypothetical protein